MAKHDDYRQNLAHEIHGLMWERDKKLSDVENLPYWETVKSAAREEILKSFQKSISDLQSTPEYKEADKLHKEDLKTKRKLWILEKNPDIVFDDNFFAECLDNLQKKWCTEEDWKYFKSNYLLWFEKLNVHSAEKLISFLAPHHFHLGIDIGILDKFSDIPYKILLKLVLFVWDWTRWIADEKINYALDTIKFPFNREGFYDLLDVCSYWDSLLRERFFLRLILSRIDRWKRWQNMTKKELTVCSEMADFFSSHPSARGKYREKFWYSDSIEFIDSLLQTCLPSEIDEQLISIIISGRNKKYGDVEECIKCISHVLDKYHLDRYKFCEYYFVNDDFHHDKEWIENIYDKELIKLYRDYCNDKGISSLIPDDFEEYELKKSSHNEWINLLKDWDPEDIIKFCDKYELDWYEDLEYPIRKKFVILFNPKEKKLSCVLWSVKVYHRALWKTWSFILWWWYIKSDSNRKYSLEWYSEEFGWFQWYENWLKTLFESKGLSHVRIGWNESVNRLTDYEKEEILQWYCDRMWYDNYTSPSHHFHH